MTPTLYPQNATSLSQPYSPRVGSERNLHNRLRVVYKKVTTRIKNLNTRLDLEGDTAVRVTVGHCSEAK